MSLADLGITKAILKRIPDGGSIKVPHEGCSLSDAMKITNTVDGFSAHCFKCNEHHFSYHEDQSARDRLKRQQRAEALTKIQAENSHELPADFSHTIAPSGLRWLGQGGWTHRLITKYGIGWSDSLGRVIIPVYNSNNCYYGYTARAVFNGQAPKYWENLPPDAVWRSHNEDSKVLVMTEDVLSAGRVGVVTPAVSVLGTTVTVNQLMDLIAGVDHLVVWLDDDAAGRKGAKAIQDVLQWCGLKVSYLFTKRDPKLLTTRKITECLQSIGFYSSS